MKTFVSKGSEFIMPTVIVATSNPLKEKAVYNAFSKFFDTRIYTEIMPTPTGVPRQPFDDDIIVGAKNRITQLKWKCKILKHKYDYLVAIEAGIIKIGKNWYNVHFCIIENYSGRRSTAFSETFPVPEKYIEQIKKESINSVFKDLFNNSDGVSVLTNGVSGRKKIMENCVIMALSGLLNRRIW